MPVAVPTGGVLAGKTLVQIAAGGYEVCALDQQHAVYCWGHNPHGLGSSRDWEPSTKGAVDMKGALAGKTVTQITAGHYDMCAVDTSGAVYCWGPDPEPIGPYPPQNVTATPGSTSIDVSWTPPAGTATIDGYLTGERVGMATRAERAYAMVVIAAVGGWLAAATVVGPAHARHCRAFCSSPHLYSRCPGGRTVGAAPKSAWNASWLPGPRSLLRSAWPGHGSCPPWWTYGAGGPASPSPAARPSPM